MTIEQQQVKDFMQKFGQECPEKPTMPSLEVRKLRAKIMWEEMLETIAALGLSPKYIKIADPACSSCRGKGYYTPSGYEHSTGCHCLVSVFSGDFIETGKPSLILLADGLADNHYVSYCGTALACGLDMEPIFAEVHRSNMTKLWSTTDLRKTWSFADDLEGCSDAYVNAGTDKELRAHRVGAINSLEDQVWLVKNKDGKVIKSPSYSPANLAPLIEAQSERSVKD